MTSLFARMERRDLMGEATRDTYLRCTVCGRESTTDFASSLRTGWEKCCGYTMRLERTIADIDAAVGEAFAPLTAARAAQRKDAER